MVVKFIEQWIKLLSFQVKFLPYYKYKQNQLFAPLREKMPEFYLAEWGEFLHSQLDILQRE